jgi:hypothetical protein
LWMSLSFVFGGYKRQRGAFYDRNAVTTTRWNVNAFVLSGIQDLLDWINSASPSWQNQRQC